MTGRKARYEQCTVAEMRQASPDREFGGEVGDMLEYSSHTGYDGGEARRDLPRAEDIGRI